MSRFGFCIFLNYKGVTEFEVNRGGFVGVLVFGETAEPGETGFEGGEGEKGVGGAESFVGWGREGFEEIGGGLEGEEFEAAFEEGFGGEGGLEVGEVLLPDGVEVEGDHFLFVGDCGGRAD